MSKSFFVAVLCAGLAGVAAAQDRPPLRGPEVREQRVPGLRQPFSGEGKGDKNGQRAADRGIPQRIYMEIVGRLRGDSAPEGLRLSDEQEQRIRKVNEEFRGAMRQYAREDRPDRKPPPDGAPQGPPGDRRPEGPARQRMEDFRAGGPKPADVQTKIWEILSPAQQEFVKVELGKARQTLEQQRAEQSMERFVRERRAKAPDGAAPRPEARPDAPRPEARPEAPRPGEPGAPPRAAGPQRERLRRIADMLAQLEPEERERLLSRIEEELQKRTQGLPARQRRRGEPKPPPPLDDVRVPDPNAR